MAKRRGVKTPTKIKKLQGTNKPSREMANEMMPKEVDSLEPVNLINPFADGIWLKLTRNLAGIGMLNEIDQELLMAYCNEMGVYFDCMDKVKAFGYVTVTPSNGEIVSNYMKVGNTALQNAIKLSDKFGFNPAARTKIEMPVQKKKTGFDELF
ncbi:MAG: phage terminase small subunit P27 family [Proteobacteria bacterium]|nr:phage terminase small subunit P27 family [Pseudomonadota bacterium]